MWSHTTTHNHAQWLCGRLWRSEVSLTPLSGVLTWCGRPLGVSWQPREVRVAQDRICIGKKGVEENGLLDYIPISEVDSIEGAAHSHKASRHASMVNLFQKVDAVHSRLMSSHMRWASHAYGRHCSSHFFLPHIRQCVSVAEATLQFLTLVCASMQARAEHDDEEDSENAELVFSIHTAEEGVNAGTRSQTRPCPTA